MYLLHFALIKVSNVLDSVLLALILEAKTIRIPFAILNGHIWMWPILHKRMVGRLLFLRRQKVIQFT